MAASSQWRCRAASGTAGHDERWKQSQSSRGEKQDMTGDDYEQGQGQRGVRTGMKGMETKQTSRQDRQRPQSRWERGRAEGQRKRYEGHRQTVWDLERPSGEKSHLKRQRRLWRYRMVNRWVSIWVFKNRDCFFFFVALTQADRLFPVVMTGGRKPCCQLRFFIISYREYRDRSEWAAMGGARHLQRM